MYLVRRPLLPAREASGGRRDGGQVRFGGRAAYCHRQRASCNAGGAAAGSGAGLALSGGGGVLHAGEGGVCAGEKGARGALGATSGGGDEGCPCPNDCQTRCQCHTNTIYTVAGPLVCLAR
ncbi:hypothetical protein FA95DRAFT_305538 [Auriscalpium vulgare]|uniref:Uncharacterized protein n=1 Tax=Auriscalpium vulgare TaxID=40419 RepID=A0ACB8RJW5_9AGAM|nr:hypothetical protein FA95DRAFT_305538 [Auriscalpium vulgare]